VPVTLPDGAGMAPNSSGQWHHPQTPRLSDYATNHGGRASGHRRTGRVRRTLFAALCVGGSLSSCSAGSPLAETHSVPGSTTTASPAEAAVADAPVDTTGSGTTGSTSGGPAPVTIPSEGAAGTTDASVPSTAASGAHQSIRSEAPGVPVLQSPGVHVSVSADEVTGPLVSSLPAEVVNRLPGGLRSVLFSVSLQWGCHPRAGCHYGVWDEGTNTVWLAEWLPVEPSLLFDVLAHELAHAADSQRLDPVKREQLYRELDGPASPDELLADCVALASGAAWTHYWECPSTATRQLVLQTLGFTGMGGI
jgi:hypothetical protein